MGAGRRKARLCPSQSAVQSSPTETRMARARARTFRHRSPRSGQLGRDSIGEIPLPRIPTIVLGMALGVIAAAPSLVYLRGFTVDDALIPARYAANIARGLGYRFNPSGPSTDGVTPLGWAYVLAPFAAHGPLAALRAARVLGWLAWLGAAGALGAAVAAASPSRWRYLALVLLLGSAPLGAWAS